MQARKHTLTLIFVIFFLLLTNNSFAAGTDFKAADKGGAKSKIIASFYEGNNHKKLIVGLEMEIDNGWKIYAPDQSGQTNFMGIPPSFSFNGSQNIDVQKFNPIFPAANILKEQIGSETIEYGVYQDKVIIPIELEIIDLNKETNLEVEVNYGLCKEICIPANQKFSLKIPVNEIDNKALEKIQQFLPDKNITSEKFDDKATQLVAKISFITALIIAFIGGAILNIMPCVLPVLSIKLLSIINHHDSKLGRIRLASFFTILGIVFSFVTFAIVTVFLKSIGNSVGWGFQFQNPYFLIFLLAVLMVFIANLLGLFEFNLGNYLGSVLNRKIDQEEHKRNIFVPNFLSGILAVLLATPCSAPFVGVAISFALSSGTTEIFLIFVSMSLGLALPYLFLIAFPKLVKILPKPGLWMLRVKNLMAGFLAATAVWLVYILIDNIGWIAALSAAILAILILLFFKILHKSFYKGSVTRTKIFIYVLIFISLIAAIFIVPNRLVYLDKMMEKSQSENWIKFDEAQIPILVAEGKTVLVDITADWCITCKVNKSLVLDSIEIKTKLRDKNIVAMRGDLTKPDEKIFNFMKKHNRYGIPFNIVFGKGAPEGVLTSELLSKSALLKAIDQASTSK